MQHIIYKHGHDTPPHIEEPSLTCQSEWVISQWHTCLSNNCFNWFMHRCFILKVLLWMEPRARGSLMTILVAMGENFLLPPDLLNQFISLLWKRLFTLHPPFCCHSFPTVGNDMVMQTKKITSFLLWWFLLIISNMLIIKMNLWISRIIIPFLVVSSVIMVIRTYLSSSIATCTSMGWWWSVPINPLPWWVQQCLF